MVSRAQQFLAHQLWAPWPGHLSCLAQQLSRSKNHTQHSILQRWEAAGSMSSKAILMLETRGGPQPACGVRRSALRPRPALGHTLARLIVLETETLPRGLF